MKILIPMGGSDTAFRDAGYLHGKALIEIAGKALIQHVYENLLGLGGDGFIFVIRKEDHAHFHLSDVLRLMAPGCRVVIAEGNTAGAACTALLAIGEIGAEEELVIANGDQIIRADLGAAIRDFRERRLDAGTLVFDSIHPRWSFVRVSAEGANAAADQTNLQANLQANLVIEAAEKRPISRHATAGLYYFRKGGDFATAATTMIRKGAHVNGLYYVCPVFNEMILRQARIGIHAIDAGQYYSLANPQGVQRYEELLSRQSMRSPVTV